MTEVYRVDVEITAPVYDTEVTDRVADAVAAVFPNAEPTFERGELRATVHDMGHFSELLHQQAILDTARGVFFENRRGDVTTLQLKKQAAFQGVVNFVVGEPDELGAITVRVRVLEPDFETFVDRVAPPTEDGQPIDV